MYLGIDIGGTFTDLVLMDEDGWISTAKALTTPGELEIGVLNAVALAAKAQGVTPEALLGQVKTFGHGTTQATNALIERTGARTGLITTKGFGDTIELQRLMGFAAGVSVDQLGWYSRRRYPQPIVPRKLRREVLHIRRKRIAIPPQQLVITGVPPLYESKPVGCELRGAFERSKRFVVAARIIEHRAKKPVGPERERVKCDGALHGVYRFCRPAN